VLEEAPAAIPRRPQLTLVRQQTSAAEIVERVLARIRQDRVDATDPVGWAAPEEQLPAVALGGCEGCGLVYELDLLGAETGDQVAECDDCGASVQVIAFGDDPIYLAGVGAGWEAHARALRRVKEQLTPRIRDGPWAVQQAQQILGRAVPGPFGGSDRQWSQGGPIRGDPEAETGFEHWDWPAIEEREQRARQKSASLPKCSVCSQPVWSGDGRTTHGTCSNQGKRRTGATRDRFHPDAIAASRAHDRYCARGHAPGEPCPAPPDPDDLAQIWAGRARMAAARRAAGAPLGDIDREALRRAEGEDT
jgi:hypothetical protein